MESQRQSLVRGMAGSVLWSLSSTARLVSNMFKPSPTPVMADSSAHMDADSLLEIEFKGEHYEGLQRGFTVPEMAARVSQTLKSIGLTYDFAPLVYILGHGASSVNNPYYAGYDCGACCGRPGSVNARVLAMMANRTDVRRLLAQEYGLTIPEATRFVGASTIQPWIRLLSTIQPAWRTQDFGNNISVFRMIFTKLCALIKWSARVDSITLNMAGPRLTN